MTFPASKPHKPKSIYARGADDGLWLGIIFIAIFALAAASLTVQWVNVLVILLAVSVPFYVYSRLRSTYLAAHGLTTFSALWMQGIMMFAAASLLLGLASFVYMRFVRPDFIVDVIRFGAEFYGSLNDESSQELAREFNSIIENNLVPAPRDVVLMWMWGAVFSGSILSMIDATLVRMRRVPSSPE